GAIAPGLKLMLAALHEHTAQLPALEFDQPVSDRGPLGKDTAHAMQLGVQASARGLVRQLLEEYAEFYGGYPQVVATGGDAPALFLQQGESDGVVEHIVPDLQLIGIQACVQAAAEAEA
ncbi:MAG: type III pantothenate kinase, partial [Planctomycetota bacterium]